jgi:quercetin dioxygenase-like cupin family protein
MTTRTWWGCLVVSLVVLGPSPVRAEEAKGKATNVAEMKFVAFPGMPTCATGSVQNGDPGAGSSIIFARMAAGCTFPWHWHTPAEHLMIVSGTAKAEMKGGAPATLRAGAFALMPSKHVHRFSCPTACTLYIYSDAPFDMHYVDDAGKEMTPDDALKPLKETAAKPPAP